ncbi:hypothetical protein BS50DRAFT_676173 [Corynespora cassiicola Philippines]|uniref:Fe2OG dioxygenase domain-containing protein n=1 Tax=Corynespora cassiicola Philippines TaxID=1448308 RepID=A0A2T2NS56_CORCC|nr:hypothetical protein BS50DRAFT_676173 [Corynespora cassiicola Philippines]
MAESLEKYRIKSLPPNFYYIPNFISAEEEASLLNKIPPQRWTPLTHRRLQAHPSTLTPSTNTLLASPLPRWLSDPILPRLQALDIFAHTPHAAPNHVLINEYRPGEGIMPHEDGGAYAPVVATVSLGGVVCLRVCAKTGDGDEGGEGEGGGGVKLPARILQERGSLLVTTGEAYGGLLHGIEPVEVDEGLGEGTVANWGLLGDKGVFEGGSNERGVRVSLTYRDVLRVSKAAGKVLGRR